MAINTMSGTQKKVPSQDQIDAFMNAAPDAGKQLQEEAAPKRKLRGSRVVISHSLFPDVLDELDRVAAKKRKKRTEVINEYIRAGLEREQ